MRTALFCVLVIFLCQACNQQTRKADNSQANPEAEARRMMLSGEYYAAAQEYTRLAESQTGKIVYYQLRTADNLDRSGDTEQALQILDAVQPVVPGDVFYRSVLQGRIALAQGQTTRALELLSNQAGVEMPADIKAEWHRTRARAFATTQNFYKAAEERFNLDAYLLDPVKRRVNIQNTWEDLNRIKLPVLQELRNSSSGAMSAWVELAIINRTMLFKGDVLNQAVASWAEQYPGHIAIPTITSEIINLSQQAVLRPKHLAILLPLSGQYEKAAHAIRDGFLAAWYQDQDYRPRISIYDSNALNVDNMHQQAVRDGADFIVGPLEKQAIETLLRREELPVTTLALNHTDQLSATGIRAGSGSIPRLIQFGLSPEDEARQAAERGIFDGHNKALVITPANDWGDRIARAFSETWTSLGGRILERVNYDSRLRDYSTPVKRLLNIDSSQLRANKLRQKLNRSIKSQTRLREDADMIFMAALPLSARQIVPQFKFHLAAHIPVYSSSHAYSGIVNREADRDMDGIVFTDIPALLEEHRLSSAVHSSLNDNWAVDTSNLRRLYALGIDAYRMIPYIGKLSLQDTAIYNGETGELHMDDDGRIRRKLLWARFVNGRARLLSN